MADASEYDVALSFAGEDRDYVEDVAKNLESAGIHVFYDKFEEVDLWGKDLYTHLDEVYRRKARFCVMFISEAYGRKLWTNHERESAQARAFKENREYILPARFDDSEIPGIRLTTGYIDLREKTPLELAKLVVEKIQAAPVDVVVPVVPDAPNFRLPKVGGQNFNPYEVGLQFISDLSDELKSRCDSLSESGISASLFDREGRVCLRVVLAGEVKYSLDVWLGALGSSDDSVGFHGARGKITSRAGTLNAWGDIKWDRDKEIPILDFHDMSLLGFVGDERQFAFEEFTDSMWEAICDALEDRW